MSSERCVLKVEMFESVTKQIKNHVNDSEVSYIDGGNNILSNNQRELYFYYVEHQCLLRIFNYVRFYVEFYSCSANSSILCSLQLEREQFCDYLIADFIS